ncbi:methyltransferase domain-containing protein [Clostridium sp. SYSU_GA19001]|uniref:class I SAM-dependent methyltransferase n=1 Tax=Clostridium caldaquaticum TaxID=2940653 RepID=UPI0020777949|nr:class I SAM-dependent methyltransferase [Clostridium caldaquaticum]MCM8711118.1 methyltransferase domain-containing protein [Clostridium caldaquaticum]
MKFYKELSKVYDIVFPKDDKTFKFLCKDLKGNSKVLDLACGTGNYSVALALRGHRVDAIDLGVEMIELAKSKGGLYANFVVGDMTKFKEHFPMERYDLAFCIGNSVVHLKSKEKIEEFIKNIYEALNDEGILVVQIVNYDRIIKYDVKSLPTIDRPEKGVKFVRNYNYKEDEEKVEFQTELIISKNDIEDRFENSVDLIALKKDELLSMFEKSGFKDIEVYGDFGEEEFNETSFSLVMRGFKR